MEVFPSTTWSLNAMADIEAFVEWFQRNGGYLDVQAMGIVDFPGSGRGAIALSDIPEGHTLFTLPRTLTLSTRTSPLPSLFGLEAWRAHELDKDWVGLILCMMWEDAWAHELNVTVGSQVDVKTRWGPYICTLPKTFDTPMFWSAEELEELRGTAVIDKIGRDDAERAYSERLVPAIKLTSHYAEWYTLDAYHRAGSRILSRSFMVSRWPDAEDEEDGWNAVDKADPRTSTESPMCVDNSHSPLLDNVSEKMDSDSEADDDPSDVAMVPMADLLNARWGSENAKLFYEPVQLRMVTTKKVEKGEQIFNTYGDPPNSDLLRRYGHVDMVRINPVSLAPTPNSGDIEMENDEPGTEAIQNMGNPSDVVEIRADLVVEVVGTTRFGLNTMGSHARVEWWLDEGEDDVFVISLPEPGSDLPTSLPPELISLIRLLILSEPDFEHTRSKGRLPKGKLGKTNIENNKEVLEVLAEVLKQRERMYIGGSVEDDEHLLSIDKAIAKRKRHAVIVRLGEKRILNHINQTVQMAFAELSSIDGNARSKEKNPAERKQNGGVSGIEGYSSRKRVAQETRGDRGEKKARRR